MKTVLTPDICVIGAGSGGLSVAAGAAAFGVKVVLVERARMGGDCLNTGCVPSKSLIAAAKHAHAIAEAPKFGITAGLPQVDFSAVNERVKSVIAAIAPNDSIERFTGLGVEVISASARFVSEDTVEAGDVIIRPRRFVIATGSAPFIPPIPGLETVEYLTNESLFDLTRLPEHLLIIGGGPVGLEMAQAHRRLGARVTVVQSGKALAKEDPELSRIVIDRIRQEGVILHEDTSIQSVERTGTGVRLVCQTAAGPIEIEGSDLLVAAGRAASLDGLGLDAAGIKHDRKGVAVGAGLRSSNPRVYAIGDAAGGLQFTHVAGYHAGLVLQQILFRLPARENRTILPRATYTSPEIATIGLSEREARETAGAIEVLRWPLAENDRAQAEGECAGLIKIIVDRRTRILGVAIVGAGAGEMINMWTLAMTNRMKLKHVRGYVSAYPTMSEIGKRAVMSYYAPVAAKPLVRSLLRFLRLFG
ncbi:dihydrolipoyl dehydrogenase family protein [Pararhizobium sp.]|uniref:dihydrolipoyl dehydrogenase family protein n=1 Tax=Pararhizobium sp. TaxID=1977563 RepID=UPI00271D2137|nr:FAD-dependent oxidoreductase [Pararhizobium sp.]MDO9416402.1 FAD-dependent oxidoreductase [Pararhizobium sp.]